MDDAAKDSPAHCAMQLNRDKATFSRDETLPFRYGWLPKGREALEQSPAIFSQPEQAMITLGVGPNRVHASQSCTVDAIQRRRLRLRSPDEGRRFRPIPVLRPEDSFASADRYNQQKCGLSLQHLPGVYTLPTATTQGV